jgi:hypothetical protein
VAPAVGLATAALAAPHVPVGDSDGAANAAGMAAYAGGVLVAMLATSLSAAAPDVPARRAWIFPLATLLGAVSLALVQSRLHGASPWLTLGYCVALLATCASVGALIGARIQEGGHLLPASVVAACADILSVVSAHGPSHAIASSDRLLSLFAVGFPLMGTRFVVPTIGAGDVTFVALVLAAIERHGLGFRRAITLVALALLAAGATAYVMRDAIPALPFVALAIITGIPGVRAVPRRDRTVAAIAIGVSLALVAWAWIRRGLG